MPDLAITTEERQFADDFLLPRLRTAGEQALKLFSSEFQISAKSHARDLVTDADNEVSDFLVSEIHARFPDHSILSEELAERISGTSAYEWVIDPIDGTYPFANGMPDWCILVALQRDGATIFGAAYAPVSNALYTAYLGSGAYRNIKKLEISPAANGTELCLAVAATGTGDHGPALGRLSAELLDRGTWPMSTLSMMNWCHLATGAVDIILQNGGKDWDYLAPVLIAREAGARVTDCAGNEWSRGTYNAVAAHPAIHPTLIEALKRP